MGRTMTGRRLLCYREKMLRDLLVENGFFDNLVEMRVYRGKGLMEGDVVFGVFMSSAEMRWVDRGFVGQDCNLMLRVKEWFDEFVDRGVQEVMVGECFKYEVGDLDGVMHVGKRQLFGVVGDGEGETVRGCAIRRLGDDGGFFCYDC